MPTITFGELLDSAARHVTAAEESRSVATPAADTIFHLGRLVTGAARCLRAVTAYGSPGAADLPRWQRTALELHEALHQAADGLNQAAGRAGDLVQVRRPHTIRHLAAAADKMAAGHDLLRTQMSIDSDRSPVDRSPWARMVTAEPVVIAMTSEMARWADTVAAWTGWLNLNSTGLAKADEWLDIAHQMAAPTATWQGQNLLRAIPSAIPPERIPPDGTESVAELFAGISVTADRLRALAFTLPGQATRSPDAAAPALRRAAYSAAIVSDAAALILRTLSTRARQLRTDPPAAAQLLEASAAFSSACNTWRRASSMWQIVATDTLQAVSPIAEEIHDLVLRMGRLAFADAAWTPARSPHTQPRDPASLAVTKAAIPVVLGAVHQAADALTHLASTNLTVITTLADAGRLYLPNRIACDETAARGSWAKMPPDRAGTLLDMYRVITTACHQTAAGLDRLAPPAATPGSALAAIRPALPEGNFTLEAIDPQLRIFGQRRPIRVAAADIDAQALIRAFQNGVSLSDCARLFNCSRKSITAILTDHGVSIRTRAPQTPDIIQPQRPAVKPERPDPAEPTARAEPGPVEATIRKLGVTDPSLLVQAAVIDRAASGLVSEAGRRTPKNAAQLAAQDRPAPANPEGVRPAGPSSAASKQQPPAKRSRTRPARRRLSLADQAVDQREHARFVSATRALRPANHAVTVGPPDGKAGQAARVQLERPSGRTTWTRAAWSDRLAWADSDETGRFPHRQ
jgi:hypothetical protein